MAFVSYPKAYIGLPFPKRAEKQNLAVVHLHVVTFECGICRITIEIITINELLEACAIPAD